MAELRSTLALPDTSMNSQFFDTDDGKYYRRVRATGKFGLQALTERIDTLILDLTDVEVELTALLPFDPKVNGFTLTNEGELNNLFFKTDSGFTTTWVSGSITRGKRIGPGESQNIPVTSNVKIYAKCESGKTTQLEFALWI